jgi:hypothetical protein
VSNLFSQLPAAEARIEGQRQIEMSANVAARGGGSFRGHHGRGG